jgi:hypothetical protein
MTVTAPARDILWQRFALRRKPAVTRNNIIYLILGALVIAVAGLSYQLYQDRHPPQGMQINIGPGGLSIQGK